MKWIGMTYLSHAASLTIGIASILSLYTALLHLTRRNLNRFHIFRLARGFVISALGLQLYCITRDLHLERPWLLYPFVTLLFVTGPLNYIRYFIFLNPGKPIPLRVKAQFIPVMLIFALETGFYGFRPGDSQMAARNLTLDPAHSLIAYSVIAGVIAAVFQYIILLRLEYGYIRKAETREPMIISSVLMVCYMVNLVIIGGGLIFSQRAVMLSGILLFGLTGIAYLFFENRYPDFYQLLARETREVKYKKSLLQGLSKEKITNRLTELMEVEKVYLEMELKLDDVAGMLQISAHQLSELINDSLGTNFTSYINRYRIEEAKERLRNNPEESTLAIAFQVGFGSKQRFNTLFKQETGMTPSGYRKQFEEKMVS